MLKGVLQGAKVAKDAGVKPGDCTRHRAQGGRAQMMLALIGATGTRGR